MKKILIFSTLTLAALCLFGDSQFSSSFWFIGSNSLTHSFLIFVILLLVTLLIVRPPRPKHLRIVTGITAAFLMIFAGYGVMNYQITVLEWVVYSETAIVLMLEALEVTTLESVTRKKLSAKQAHQPAFTL